MTWFLNSCQPEGFFSTRLQTPFQANSIRVLFACRNQHSLKLYTVFFISVNKKFNFFAGLPTA